jgi:hypothetical protein
VIRAVLGMVIGALLGGGCNATSSGEIKQARLAVYDCDRTVVEAAVRAELRKYGRVDQEATEPYALQTETRWYTKFGQAGVRVARDEDFLRSQGLVPIPDDGENSDAIILAYRAKVLRAPRGWRVVTEYAAARWLRDRQLPEPLGPENASRPAWIDQRVHGLHVNIHRRLSACAVAPKPREPVDPSDDPTIDEPSPRPAPDPETAPAPPEDEPVVPAPPPEDEPEPEPDDEPDDDGIGEPAGPTQPLPGADPDPDREP